MNLNLFHISAARITYLHWYVTPGGLEPVTAHIGDSNLTWRSTTKGSRRMDREGELPRKKKMGMAIIVV